MSPLLLMTFRHCSLSLPWKCQLESNIIIYHSLVNGDLRGKRRQPLRVECSQVFWLRLREVLVGPPLLWRRWGGSLYVNSRQTGGCAGEFSQKGGNFGRNREANWQRNCDWRNSVSGALFSREMWTEAIIFLFLSPGK